MSGMVVLAGSGARQFHVKWSRALNRAFDFPVWVVAKCGIPCECGCTDTWAADLASYPDDFIREWREVYPIALDAHICERCHGHFIE